MLKHIFEISRTPSETIDSYQSSKLKYWPRLWPNLVPSARTIQVSKTLAATAAKFGSRFGAQKVGDHGRNKQTSVLKAWPRQRPFFCF